MSAKVTISEAIARPVRTGVQAVPAYGIVEFVDAFVWDMNERQYAALVVFLTMLIGLAQNAAENGLGRAFLRQVPPTQAPIIDDSEHGDFA